MRSQIGTESYTVKECKFCREAIHSEARLCKECGEPQGHFSRGLRFISSVLSLFVALGSLGIAYLQYDEAKLSRENEKAATGAVTEIVGALDETSRRQLRTKLSPGLQDETTLRRELQARPMDQSVRRDLLLRQMVIPRERPPQ